MPGYISRSVAGSYDNEAIAIFLLMFTFFCWIKALKTGSAFFGTLAALFYFYMVAAWGECYAIPDCLYLTMSLFLGGYAFITNMIPLHSLALILMGRFSSRLYVAYSSWYAVGTLSSMQVPFVGFQPVRTSEHMAALGETSPFFLRNAHSSAFFRGIRFTSDHCLRRIGTIARIFKAVQSFALRVRYRNGALGCWRHRSPNL